MSEQRHAARVQILESVLRGVLSEEGRWRQISADDLWSRVAVAVDRDEFGERTRHETRMLIQYAGTYIDLFAMRDPWELEDSTGGLGWRREEKRVADCFALRTADSSPWSRQDRAGIRRVLTAGRECYGAEFLGVRVLFPIRPGRSLWLSDHRQPAIPLEESGLWEITPPVAELRRQLVEGERR